jgi:hypothetical protein
LFRIFVLGLVVAAAIRSFLAGWLARDIERDEWPS